MKTAFVFAGQGAQKIGMGRDIAEKYPSAMQVFEKASEACGMSIMQLVWEGDSETLMLTENTQPAVVTMSAACLAVLKENGVRADYAAGLSLGEYTAHIAAGSLSLEQVVPLVKKRGRFMQEAVPAGKGGMAAIIGLDNAVVAQCCEDAKEVGYVEPANYNCPGQIVIAGEKDAVEKACALCKEKGAKRALPLPVSAPFHCKMLKPAGEKLSAELEAISVADMKIPVLSNVTADVIPAASEVKQLLVEQVSSPVKWEELILKLLSLGVDTFVEIGPGKALTGFISRISSDVKIYNAEDVASLEQVIEAFKAGRSL